MFTDEHRYDIWNELRQHGIRKFSAHLTPALLAKAAQRCGLRVVRSPLCAFNLVWLGIAAAFDATKSFACILTATLKCLEDSQGFTQTKLGKSKKAAKHRRRKRSKHSPYRNDPTIVSEEAFVKARQRIPLSFWMALLAVLCETFEEHHRERLRFRGFRILAMDGTRLSLPEAEKLHASFGNGKNALSRGCPQARMMLLQFPFVRLPYRYLLSPVSTGEITQATTLAKSLSSNDLVLLDAGFLSYGLFCTIQNQQAYFAIRLGCKLGLKTRKKLGRGDRLVRWAPKDSRGQWRKAKLPPSIDLRVVEYQVRGFRRQSILTNVCSPSQISREDWTRLTTACGETGKKFMPGLYHRRWEIETTYYELKVRMGLDRHLRSHTPASIQYEVAGYVVLYLLVRWLMVEAAVKHGFDPLNLSFLDALRELESMRVNLICSNATWVARVLLPRLLDRIAEHQVPVRPGRHYPRRKRVQPTNAKTLTKKG
jgi:hypothetical protein